MLFPVVFESVCCSFKARLRLPGVLPRRVPKTRNQILQFFVAVSTMVFQTFDLILELILRRAGYRLRRRQGTVSKPLWTLMIRFQVCHVDNRVYIDVARKVWLIRWATYFSLYLKRSNVLCFQFLASASSQEWRIDIFCAQHNQITLTDIPGSGPVLVCCIRL